MSEVEKVARAFVRERITSVSFDFDEWWANQAARYYEMCAEWPGYANSRGLITDAFRDARIAIAAIDEARGWRPIESAPNDVVLVTNGGYCVPAVRVQGVWVNGWEDDNTTVRVKLMPTHWQPLPAPPKEVGE